MKARFMASQYGPAGTGWYAGTVRAVHDDESVDVEYDDGEFEARVKREYLKAR